MAILGPPFYSRNGITIYNGKADEVLRVMPDQQFGLLVLDAPFTIRLNSTTEVMEWMKVGAKILVMRRDGYIILPPKSEEVGWEMMAELAPKAEFGHPNARPVDALCQIFAKCGADSLIDPYMGTGSSLVAAKKLGLRAVGIDIDKNYCEMAKQRLEHE